MYFNLLMGSPHVDKALFERLLQADELGIRLEVVGGLSLWEPSPFPRHQRAIDRIRASIDLAPAGTCYHAANVYIAFPDGSLKRPDISVFCREPDEEDEAITLVPEAVIEVISKGYEAKDLEIGPRFYLSQGVKDVIVFDPHTLLVLHLTPQRPNATSPPSTSPWPAAAPVASSAPFRRISAIRAIPAISVLNYPHRNEFHETKELGTSGFPD